MLGGYQIIDLSGMNIALSSDVVSITDQKVLRQLLALRDHIEENYNFTKPLNKKLKPVMIRLRDKESGEKLEGALWGNLSIVDDNLSFNIDAIVTASPLKVLQINVVFEKKQDDDGNDYYDIKSAKYEYKGGEDVVTVTNIKNISSAIINKLDCGDIVLKKDSSGLHAYIVSFRNATGICLTYTDASVIETQSYDKVGQNWVYNSEDKSTLPEFAQSGTIVDALGLDNEGKLVKQKNINKTWGGTLPSLQGLNVGAIVFAKACRNGNEINFIFNARLKNETASDITLGIDELLFTYDELDEDIMEKIFTHNGISLKNETENGSVAMTPLTVAQMNGHFVSLHYANLYYNVTLKRLRYYLEGTSLVVPANSTRDLEARISLAIN